MLVLANADERLPATPTAEGAPEGCALDVTCRPCPVPCGSAHLAKIQVGVMIGAPSTDSSEPSIAHDAWSQHSLRPPPSAAWSVPRPQSPTPNHHFPRRHPNRLMWMFLRYRGSSARISTSSCRVKRSLCRRCPTRPEPQTGRNDPPSRGSAHPSPSSQRPLPWISVGPGRPTEKPQSCCATLPFTHGEPAPAPPLGGMKSSHPVESQGEFGRPGIATDGPMKAKAPAPRQSRCGHMPSSL